MCTNSKVCKDILGLSNARRFTLWMSLATAFLQKSSFSNLFQIKRSILFIHGPRFNDRVLELALTKISKCLKFHDSLCTVPVQ